METQRKNEIIQKALGYDISHVVKRFAKDNNISFDDVIEYEIELKRFLILCVLYPNKQFAMSSEIVDELWHTFIWHTQSYFDFCKSTGGKYIHHEPTPGDHENLECDEITLLYLETFDTLPSLRVWSMLNQDIKEFTCSRSPASCHHKLSSEKYATLQM